MNMTRDFNDTLDDINFAEQRRHRQMGFTRGYSVGEEAGWRDGYLYGVRKGAHIAAEIGYYQGFSNAWISMLEKDDVSKQRKLTALKTLLEMTRSFPKTNLQDDDTIQKLGRIRAKFKQVNALLFSSFGGSGDSGSGSGYGFFGPSWTSQASQDSGVPGSMGSYSVGTSSMRSSPTPFASGTTGGKSAEMSF